MSSSAKRTHVSQIAASWAGCLLVVCSVARASEPRAAGRGPEQRSAYRIPPGESLPAPRSDHPLVPALQMALDSYRHIRREVRDYSCTVTRRERVDGRLGDYEYMVAKVRHPRTRGGEITTPFGVYLRFLGPGEVKGREVLFVDGQNDGQMFARNGGKRFSYVTTRLNPDSELAMRGNRYPVTEFGFENLIKRLIEVAREEIANNCVCQVKFFRDAKVNGRVCTGLEVTHPQFDERLRFHQAKVFMDRQWQIPIHYEAHDWPREAGGEPLLLEQYTYTDIQLNIGLDDKDFDHANPKYRLR